VSCHSSFFSWSIFVLSAMAAPYSFAKEVPQAAHATETSADKPSRDSIKSVVDELKRRWEEAKRQKAEKSILENQDPEFLQAKDEKIRRDYQDWQESPFKGESFQKYPPYDRIRQLEFGR